MEDLHRAGGIPAILGELDRAGLIDHQVHTVHSPTVADWLKNWDIRSGDPSPHAVEMAHAAPGCVRSASAFSQSERWRDLDLDASHGCIHDVAHAHSADGGLAVLRGNLAVDGALVKSAGVDDSLLVFTGPAVVFESQEAFVDAILGSRIRPGEVIVIRYEGPGAGQACRKRSTPPPTSRAEG